MKIRFVSILSALITFFCVVDTKGIDTPTLPVSLPIGNRQAMLDSAVTNEHTQIYLFYAFTEPERIGLSGIAGSKFISFRSYEEFKIFSITNAWRNKEQIDKTFPEELQPSLLAQAILIIAVSFSQPAGSGQYEYDSGSDRATLIIQQHLGLYHQVVSNDLYQIEPYLIKGVTWFTNLQQFSAEIQTPTGLYQNQWNGSTQTWTNTDGKNLIGEIVGNTILFDGCNISPTNRARFTAQLGGSPLKGTYTQDGARIVSSSLQIKDNQLAVSMSKGSDTTIESSVDLVNWIDEITIPWSFHTNTISVPINTSAPLKLFRAKSR